MGNISILSISNVLLVVQIVMPVIGTNFKVLSFLFDQFFSFASSPFLTPAIYAKKKQIIFIVKNVIYSRSRKSAQHVRSQLLVAQYLHKGVCTIQVSITLRPFSFHPSLHRTDSFLKKYRSFCVFTLSLCSFCNSFPRTRGISLFQTLPQKII